MIGFAFVVAAACGGILRLLAESHWPPTGPSAFPRATLLVNSVGSFVLGVLVNAGPNLRLVLGVALCGALTTLSGVSLQIHRRIVAGGGTAAFTYLAATIGIGLACAAIGAKLSGLIF